MDWSPSSPIASEDSFQDSNDTQSSLDYLYIQQQQQQQQQQQMPQQYIYTQQQAHHQQQGRFEWLDPSLTDHIAELCLIKLQQASTGRNHSLLRQVQLNSMLHRLRMLAFFRAPLPVYPHQHFHQQQQPQPYDSSDLTASFEAGAVPPVAEMGTSADHQLVMPDPSSIASLGLQASPPPLDPVRGYDWDQEALADNQLATNLSLNVLLTLDTQQQQQQPPPPQHLQQHIEHHPSSSSAPGPEQPGIRSVASPLSHLDHHLVITAFNGFQGSGRCWTQWSPLRAILESNDDSDDDKSCRTTTVSTKRDPARIRQYLSGVRFL
ncbi:hypothetical protein BGZ73_002106 [Actinomortierella ambigua]|nr:hypothetical protein BGZ73_002106 [Actinomortierella ambigua]